MSREPAIIALTAAMSYVAQAKSILTQAQTGLSFVAAQPQFFTRRQAINEAKEKMEEFGPLAAAGLRSLIDRWEEQEKLIV